MSMKNTSKSYKVLALTISALDSSNKHSLRCYKNMRIIGLYVCILTSCLLATHTLANSTLTVAVNAEYAPVIFTKDGKVAGIEHDILEMVAEELGYTLDYVSTEFDNVLSAVSNKTADIGVAGLSMTAARQQIVDFTNPIMALGQMAIIRLDRAGELSYPGTIKKPQTKVAVVKATTGQAYAQAQLGMTEVFAFANVEAGIVALRAGEVDFFIHDAPTSWRIAQESEFSDLLSLYHPLTEERIAWAVAKDNAVLLEKVNEVIEKLHAAGTIRQVQSKWIPVRIVVN